MPGEDKKGLRQTHVEFALPGREQISETGAGPGAENLSGYRRGHAVTLDVAIDTTRVMDIIFNCPECEQELEVDSSGAGSEIDCPSCGEKILIPQPGTEGTRTLTSTDTSGNTPLAPGANPVNPISSSAAAKVEMHLKVPVHARPSASLIAKPLPPLEVAAKESDKKIRIKTIRHTDCIEVGHDRFDELVSQFLGKVGAEGIVSINSINYTFLDIGTQKLMTEYGVMIIYKG